MGVYFVFCPIIVDSCLFKVVIVMIVVIIVIVEKYFQLNITKEVDIIEKIIHDVVK